MNFLTEYMRYAGLSEVPTVYHKWAALSVIAAAARDQVWYEKFRGEPLAPNAYIFLIGPSGIGKNGAIGPAVRLLGNTDVRLLRGKVTAQYLIDALAQKGSQKNTVKDARIYLVTPELSLSIGRGPLADDIVKLLTELYSGAGYEFHEGTRTHGLAVFKDHCVNWLAGTTKEWLRDSVSVDAVEGGFFGRVCAVAADYDFSVRYPKPVFPSNVEEIEKRLRGHIARLVELRGAMNPNNEAQDVLDTWYMTRPEPTDEAEKAIWKRQHDIVLKLAMVLSLCEGFDRVIRKNHVVGAQRLAAECAKGHPQLVEFVRLTKESDGVRQVKEIVRSAETIHHAALVKAMTKHGVTTDRLRVYIDTLVEGRVITRIPASGGRVVYVWGASRRQAMARDGDGTGE